MVLLLDVGNELRAAVEALDELAVVTVEQFRSQVVRFLLAFSIFYQLVLGSLILLDMPAGVLYELFFIVEANDFIVLRALMADKFEGALDLRSWRLTEKRF